MSFTCLHYIRETSNKIKRILIETGVKVAMKPYLTNGRFLLSTKDPLNERKISGMVHQVPCHVCKFTYINQTKRDLKSRLDEQKRAIKFQRTEKSDLCEHFITLNHKIDWNRTAILKTEKPI